LHGYKGKCSNIHGHRWNVVAEIFSYNLVEDGQLRGMVVDFTDFKHDLKLIADDFDHSLIYEKDTLKPKTLEALQEENFRLIEVEFRPTAENFSKHIFDILMSKGYNVKSITVYETPSNCATYTGE
jgi:6-pyruvoyltetrahydropterin/6-carboxytetrahydropterin synthase